MANVPTPRRSLLITVIFFVVAFFCVLDALGSYQRSAAYAGRYPDAYGAGNAQVRFAPLLQKIPPDAILGYFSDVPPDTNASVAAYLAGQHAVAPRLLSLLGPKDKRNPDIAIGNFSKPQDFAAVGKAYGYLMTEDLGNGVVLFRKEGK